MKFHHKLTNFLSLFFVLACLPAAPYGSRMVGNAKPIVTESSRFVLEDGPRVEHAHWLVLEGRSSLETHSSGSLDEEGVTVEAIGLSFGANSFARVVVSEFCDPRYLPTSVVDALISDPDRPFQDSRCVLHESTLTRVIRIQPSSVPYVNLTVQENWVELRADLPPDGLLGSWHVSPNLHALNHTVDLYFENARDPHTTLRGLRPGTTWVSWTVVYTEDVNVSTQLAIAYIPPIPAPSEPGTLNSQETLVDSSSVPTDVIVPEPDDPAQSSHPYHPQLNRVYEELYLLAMLNIKDHLRAAQRPTSVSPSETPSAQVPASQSESGGSQVGMGGSGLED